MIDLKTAREGWPAQIEGPGGETVTVYLLPSQGNTALSMRYMSLSQEEESLSREEKAARAMVGTVLLGWEAGAFGEGDKPLPFTEENAAAVLRVPWIADQVTMEAYELSERLAAERVAAEKKSKRRSAGSSGGRKTSTRSARKPKKETAATS